MVYIISLVIFLSLWSLVSAILITIFHKEKPIDKLKYYDEDYEIKGKAENEKNNKGSLLKKLSKAIPSSKITEKYSNKLELELMKSDIPITPGELFVIKILTSAVFAFLDYAVFRNFITTAAIFIIIWTIPKVIISLRKKARVKKFNEQLTEGIIVISNSLKAGYSFLQAIAAVSEETKDPFAKEFKKLLKEMSLGIAEEVTLQNLLNRVDSQDLRLMVNAILIQKDIGGNLSEILDNIASTIRERQKIQNELKALTAQGKLSGVIVMLIPFVLGGSLYLLNKEYMILLFTTPIGIALTVAALVNQVLGLIIIRKIIKIDM